MSEEEKKPPLLLTEDAGKDRIVEVDYVATERRLVEDMKTAYPGVHTLVDAAAERRQLAKALTFGIRYGRPPMHQSFNFMAQSAASDALMGRISDIYFSEIERRVRQYNKRPIGRGRLVRSSTVNAQVGRLARTEPLRFMPKEAYLPPIDTTYKEIPF